jgi:uncharacterized membrane protein
MGFAVTIKSIYQRIYNIRDWVITRVGWGIFLKAVLLVTLIGYPFFVYFGLTYIDAKWIAFSLLVLLILRAILLPSQYRYRVWGMIGIGMVIAFLSSVFNDPIYLRLYPVMMNILMLGIFVASLYRPPTIIEIFARLHYGADLPPHIIAYTRNVTKIWCGFFVLNASIATYTVFSELEIWTAYNGFISYVLAGGLFASEFLYRHFIVKKRARYDGT